MQGEKNLQRIRLSNQILLLVFLCVVEINSSSIDAHLKETTFERLALCDVVFTEDVLLEMSARSRIDCCKKCVESKGCVMWTFHSGLQSPPSLCRVHSRLQNVSDPRMNVSGAESFCLSGVFDAGLLTMWAAQNQCGQLGSGHLVMPKTLLDLVCVTDFMPMAGAFVTWVGADDLTDRGQFLWNDGSPVSSPSDLWKEGQTPAVSDGPQCVMMQLGEKLKAVSCNGTLMSFLCQKY
ncbi:hypothetical protein ACOMHN_007400 [Nucella lapillus]